MRDASRIRLKFPLIDDAGDGTPTTSTDTYVCVTGNFSWSGFSRGSTSADCSETTLDTWGNLVKTYLADKTIDMGSITFDIDWSPDAVTTAGGRMFAAFKSGQNGTWTVTFPKVLGTESAGPIYTFSGHVTNFNPQTNVMGTGDDARARATITIKISGDLTLTPAVAA